MAFGGGCGAQSDDSSGGSTTMTGPGSSSSTGDAPTSGGEATVTSTGEASTGDGSTGGSTGGMTGGSTGGMTSGTEAGESTTGGGCIGCAASFMGDEGELCEASQAKLDALFMCVCGACADVCVDTCTMGAPTSPTCQTCQTEAFGGACARDLMACLADA